MTEFTLGYREVMTDQDLLEKGTEITLTTGGTQSTLQDIKATEKGDGYCYTDSSRYYTRNRFIHWRINNDYLELIEQSLDVNLSGNKLKIRFIDSSILDGISVQETEDNVFILVPTVCSVHKLSFPHPSKFHKQDELLGSHPNLAAASIFSKANASDARDPCSFHVFNNPSSSIDQLPNLARSFYNVDTDEAFFVLSYLSTELLLIRLTKAGQAICQELKGESLMPRFLSGLTDKFRSKTNDGNQIVSTLIHVIDFEVHVITLSRNGNLKFWLCETGQCVFAIDIFSESDNCNTERIQAAVLRKSDCPYEGHDLLGIFVNFVSSSQFYILKIIENLQQIRVKVLNTLSSVENDLINFSLQSNCIWGAWRTNDDDCVVYISNIRSGIWTPVIKEPIQDSQPQRDASECDPRQFYLQHLFRPGGFSLHTINKALGIYRKSNLMGTEINLTSVAALKQAICLAIESDIHACFFNEEVSADEYLEHSEWCWQKFYSCCIQYHKASLRPLGFVALPQNSGAILLKKATCSFIRPMEPLEHMALSEFIYKDQFINFALLEEGQNLLDDVLILFEAIVYIEKQLSSSFKLAFERDVGMSVQPDAVLVKLLTSLQSEMEHEYNTLCDQVNSILSQGTDLYKAIHKLLELLRYDSTSASPDNQPNPNTLHYFSSNLGVSFVASCLRQQCQNRFGICRNMIILCDILEKGESLKSNVSEALHSVCKPEITYLTQAYFVMLWLTKLSALNNVPQESTLQRLAPLKLTPASNVRPQRSTYSLLELFTCSTGGQEARKLFTKIDFSEKTMAYWHLSLLPFVSSLRYVLWPLRTNTILPEWLVSSGQHVWLQQYVKLLVSWCDWNISSCSFLLAVSFLTSGENYKALNLFEIAAKGVITEPFLQKLIKDHSENQALILYYLKVIQLFELHSARDCAIQTANTALTIADPENPRVATLYSIKFKHHLCLKHYEEAFYALKSNPDIERKQDSLRDWVKTLLDERNFDVLLSFTYGDMDELFTNILLTRARATDATDNVFYDFLYAYQIKRGPLCHRLAASVMYEQAFRLSQYDNVECLEKQVKCLLTAKIMLQLVDAQHAWVVRPSYPDEGEDEIILESLAGSRKDSEIFRIKKQVEVVNIDAIKKELAFSSAKLKLARFDPSLATNITDAVELVTLLNSCGLFKTALEVATTFNISYISTFVGLTWRCLALSEDEDPTAWNWLAENDLQDLPANREDVALIAWQLLQTYLDKYEEPNSTLLHKAICEKMINFRVYIPFWLLKSYKVRNPAEILKLLHRSGRLEETFELCHEYLLATMGYGKELFGFTMSLSSNSPPFCLPVYEIQALIKELELQNMADFGKPFEKEHEILSNLFRQYLETATRISNEKCHLLLPSFGSINLR
ncbi:nuclear pore complex protein Nup160 homolog [Euwallacea similis]|uniref:nuclear pore complex protein Nup160 homolog n=1 Tax=Euwallacea similis TaxID=1736056 RepID=UPI00344E0F84